MCNKQFLGILVFAAVAFAAIAAPAQEEGKAYFEPFNVYTDKAARGNHYIPAGYMGDYSDISVTDGHQENCHSGQTCIKVTYKPNATQGARWAGMYWQYPPNNVKGYFLRPGRKGRREDRGI
jgi:hypothetical protein